MNRSLKMQLALGILSASWQAYARPAVAQAQPLGIHLYDLANISPHTLALSKLSSCWISSVVSRL